MERRGRTTTVQQENKNITKCGCKTERLKYHILCDIYRREDLFAQYFMYHPVLKKYLFKNRLKIELLNILDIFYI